MGDWTRAPGAAGAEVDGEVVVLSPADLRYHSLNDSAAAIWALLEAPTSVDRIVEQLVREFDVTADECRVDVEACLHELADLGLVVGP
jgi:hypothetical protein